MAFPSDPLPLRADLFLGDTLGWVDITSDVRLSRSHSGGGVAITRGQRNESTAADAATCSLALNNRAGPYSPRNPASPYYGLLGRNTPLRVRIDDGATGLAITASGAGLGDGAVVCADDPAIHLTGDLDIRFYGRSTWQGAQACDIAGRYVVAGDLRAWALYRTASGRLGLVWSPDGTLANRRSALSTVAVTPPADGRLAVRATLDVDNGAGGATATFYTAVDLAGPWTAVGTAVTSAGTSSVAAAAGADLEVGETQDLGQDNAFEGDIYGFEVRDGIGGTVAAVLDVTTLDLGTRSWTDTAGQSWTLDPGAHVADRSARFVGEVTSWPQRWSVDDRDRWVPIEAAGPLRRLGQGANSLRSPIYRSFIALDPAAYLPLEDGSDATRPASAARSILYGTARNVEFGQETTGLAGTSTVAKMTAADSSILAVARPGTSASGHWSVACFVKLAAVPGGSEQVFARVYVNGSSTVRRWEIAVSSTSYRWQGLDAAGSVVATSTSAFGAGASPNGWVAFCLDVQSDSGGIRWAGVWHGVGASSFWATAAGGSVIAGTIGDVAQVELVGSSYTVDAEVAHVVATPVELPFVREAFRSVSTGYAGETAGARIARLAAEEGVSLEATGDLADTAPCGPQRAEALLTILRSAADVDGGILHDSRSLLGLHYRTRVSLYNQTPLSVDYAGGQISPPFEPVEDDESVTNDVTVSRPSGSSARAVAVVGPLSTAPPPAGVGTYGTSVTVDVATDLQLPDQAGWRLHLGTVDEARYPRIRTDLATPGYQAAPDAAHAVAAADVGDLMQVAGLPIWLPPAPGGVLLRGYAEQLDVYDWTITWVAAPGSPWTVAVADGPQRAPAYGSTLDADLTSTDLTLSLASTALNGVWSVDPVDFPMDLRVGAERVTASAISGASSPQTVTLSARAVNGIARAWPAGTEVDVWLPAVAPL